MSGQCKGYLRIDCGSGHATTVPLAYYDFKRFIGGVGLGTYILHREHPPGADPLEAAAAIVFAIGPLTGSPISTSAKFAVCGKSPLTGRISDSMASSRFALAIRESGWEAICLTGCAGDLSALVVENGRVELIPVGALRGLPAAEAERALKGLLGSDFEVAAIGPAGERLVRYATISHDGRHAARGGLGAVLGSKRIKALAVRGGGRAEVGLAGSGAALAEEMRQRCAGPAMRAYRQGGTAQNMQAFNSLGLLPARNFRQATFAGARELGPRHLAARRSVIRRSCAGCQIGCEHRYITKSGAVRAEYETLFALGPLCGIGDPDAVLEAARVCDRLGLDTMSAGGTIAFAMELSERGLIDYPGLHFGSSRVLAELLPLVAERKGIGGFLAEGSRRMAQMIGGEALAWAPQVKGLELPGYEPRVMHATALGLAVGTRGADHNRSGAYEVDFASDGTSYREPMRVARQVAAEEDKAALLDSLILCKFARGALGDLFTDAAELVQAVTGWPLHSLDLRRASKRIVALRRLFNVREGWARSEDTLPSRILEEPLLGGINEGASLPAEQLRRLVACYYRSRRWAPDGIIPPREITRLELLDVGREGSPLPERRVSAL